MKPNPGELKREFLTRFVDSDEMRKEHPDPVARLAAAHDSWNDRYVGERREVRLSDRADVSATRVTRDGYLAAQARVARTGIQKYLGAEVGEPNMDVVRIYRPPEEVFDVDSMASYAHRPITDDHPGEPVSATNWKKLSVGHVGERVARDGEFVSVPLLLMDSRMIENWKEGGKRELSLGYDTELVWGKGTTPEGEEYDAVQTNIRANHLAVVAAARGGPELRIGDESRSKEKTNMTEKTLKTITIDGLPVEVTDMAASVIQKMLSGHETALKQLKDELTSTAAKLSDAVSAATKAADEAKKAIEAKDAEIATLKKQLGDAAITPVKLDELVKVRSETVGKARAVLGDKLVVDGKTDAEIRRQVVDAEMGDAAKGWSDDAVGASFRTIVSKIRDDQQSDGLREVLRDGVTATHFGDTEKAYREYDQSIQNAWRGSAKQ